MTLAPRTILAIAWGVMIAYAFPGYMNFDAGEQLVQARHGPLADWHPPIMAAYWRVIEVAVRGPFGMLVLQTALFLWGLWSLLRPRLGDRTAAWVAAALFVFPPIFTPMAVVWKDAQMAGFLLAGTALALRPRWRVRAVGLALLVLAAGVRDNGAAAIPFLGLWIVRGWGVMPRWRVAAAAIGLTVAIAGAAMGVNRALTQRHDAPWYHTVAIMDIAGTIRYAGPMSDAELHAILDGTGAIGEHDLQARFKVAYSPRAWFPLSFNDPDKVVFVQVPSKPERLARRTAWWTLVREHPWAYLRHRWAVMREVLGLSDMYVWEPVGQTFAVTQEHKDLTKHNASRSWFQAVVGKFLRKHLGDRLPYRAWAYAVLGLLLCGWAVWRKDLWVLALAGSGLLYEATYFVAAAAPDYRYSHWMVVVTCMAAAIVFVDGWRAGVRARAAAA